jgi:signal transduction histidine kinase
MRRFFIPNTIIFLISLISVQLVYSTEQNHKTESDPKFDLLIEKATSLVELATNHDTVLFLINQAEQLIKPIDNPLQVSQVLNLKGLNEYTVGNYEQAIDHYYHALDLAEQSKDSIQIAKANHNLGMVFDDLEDYDEAIHFYHNSMIISLLFKDTALTANTFQDIAITFQNKRDYTKALEYNEKAMELANLRKDTAMIIDITNNLGTIAYDQKKLKESLDYYWKAWKLYEKTNDMQGTALAYNNIGLVYLDQKNYPKALAYFNKSLDLATELGMKDFTIDIYSNLTIYYAENKDYKNAYSYYDRYSTLYDSLVGENKTKMIRQVQAKYQLVRNNRELEDLRNMNKSQLEAIDAANSFQYYLVAITALVIILMIALFFLLSKEKKLAAELQAKTAELHDLNVSKDKFFSIIAHDLKNPFNVLVSYTSILKTDLELFSASELKQIVSDLNQASENGFNLLQNLLLWTRSQTNRIQIYKSYFILYEIYEQVKALVDLNLISKEQILSTDIDPELLVYADKDMVSTVLRNLIFNAIKFSPKGSEIFVRSAVIGNFVKVDVIDSGIGISEEHLKYLFAVDKNSSTTGTDGETGTGLGLVICKEFIEKNKGEMMVKSKVGSGSVFTFTLPIHSENL